MAPIPPRAARLVRPGNDDPLLRDPTAVYARAPPQPPGYTHGLLRSHQIVRASSLLAWADFRADGDDALVLTLGSCSSFAAVVLRIVYGLDPEQGERKYYKLVERLATIAEDISTPGRHIVEAFPSMQRLPSWFPGTGFKQLAATWKAEIASIRDYLYDSAKETMVSALRPRSRTDDLIVAVGHQRRQRIRHYKTYGRACGRRSIKECDCHDLCWCVSLSTDIATAILTRRRHIAGADTVRRLSHMRRTPHI